jgi:hypothetical protein
VKLGAWIALEFGLPSDDAIKTAAAATRTPRKQRHRSASKNPPWRYLWVGCYLKPMDRGNGSQEEPLIDRKTAPDMGYYSYNHYIHISDEVLFF